MHQQNSSWAAPHSPEERDAQARTAGYAIYNSVNSTSSNSSSRLLESGSLASGSVQSIPENQRACCGIMSPVRRTFCLITLFDLILTFILWIIYTQAVQEEFFKSFQEQVIHYTFKTSLFDIVLCAAWRFVPLLLAYALFRINNPWTVALTTLGTCVFLLCKVFLFDFSLNKNNLMCYLPLITSFIIAWVEAWFLDFKVLPREQRARERGEYHLFRPRWQHRLALVVVLLLFLLSQGYMYSVPNERTPLLSGAQPSINFPSDVQYYSPVNSPEGSDDENDPRNDGFRSIPGSRGHSRNASRSSGSLGLSLGAQEQEYIKKSREVWEQAWNMFQTKDSWKLESDSKHATPEQGCVHSRVFAGMGKVFRVQGYINSSPKALFNELVIHVVDLPKWSNTLLECRILNFLDDSTSILYNVAAEAAGGLVSSRDFVNLIHWQSREGSILSAASSVTHPYAPPDNKHVRGENGPGGLFFKPVPGHPNKCHFISIVNTDLKGWLPQSIVDQALSSVLLAYVEDIRQHMAKLQARAAHR